jgi:hypothetical protein
MFTGLFMDKMVGFVKNYFPVFLLGAVFGKVIEMSGFSKSIVAAVINAGRRERAMLSIVLVCAMLTYGGVSLFVVVFAVYPFAAEMFRQSGIPKRLIPGTIALGAFTFTMDALPGTPQIQNIIPTTFFGTNTWAAPCWARIGAVFILIVGMAYLEWRRRGAAAGEGYGDANLLNEPAVRTGEAGASADRDPAAGHGRRHEQGVHGDDSAGLRREPRFVHPAVIGKAAPVVQEVQGRRDLGGEGALLVGIATSSLRRQAGDREFAEGTKTAIGGALLAADEHRFRVRLRRGHRRPAGLPGRRQCAGRDSQSAGQRGDHRHRAGRHHRLGLGRHEHRAGGDVGNLHRQRPRAGIPMEVFHRVAVDGLRRHGHPAAQRRGDHPAGRDRPDPPPVLQGHLRHHLHQDLAVFVIIATFYLTGIV